MKLKITKVFCPLKIYIDCGNRVIDKDPFVITKDSYRGNNNYSVWHGNAGFSCTRDEILQGINSHLNLIHANVEFDEDQIKFIFELIENHRFEIETK
jgi:hypothetical protein